LGSKQLVIDVTMLEGEPERFAKSLSQPHALLPLIHLLGSLNLDPRLHGGTKAFETRATMILEQNSGRGTVEERRSGLGENRRRLYGRKSTESELV
jgi:hypothetical protein